MATAVGHIVKLAPEASYGVAPCGFPSGSPWWLGGRWQLAMPTEYPTFQDRQEVIFPKGGTEERMAHRVQPVVGRRWSEGVLTAPFSLELGELLFVGLLGNAQLAQTITAQTSLLENEPINTAPKNFVLAAQPTVGQRLRFEIKGTGNPGTLGVSGIDVYGNAVSELISFPSGGLFYSRNSYRTVGDSSLAVSGITNGTLTAIGFGRFNHTISGIALPVTLSIEQAGTPDTGSAASAFIHTGVIVEELTLHNDAEAPDGLLTITAQLEGRFSTTCPIVTETPTFSGSFLRPWPAWALQVKRADSDWNKVASMDLSFRTENANYRPTADGQLPQEAFAGPVTVEGDLGILVDNDDERGRWLGASITKLEFNWSAPWKLRDAVQETMILSLASAFHETYELGEQDGQYRLNSHIRAVINTASNNTNDLVINFGGGIPSTAFGGNEI